MKLQMDDAPSYQDAASFHEHPTERLDAMRRTVAKALYGSGHSSIYGDYEENPQSPKIDELVNTVILSLMRRSVEYMKEPEGEAAMVCLVGLLARAMARFVVSEQAKVAFRVSAREAATGLWDGCHRKMDDIFMKVPRVLLWLGLLLVGTYGVLLALGLLLFLWRFSLYGLAQEKNIW